MKGLIFKELISMMEGAVGEDTTEEILDSLDLKSGAAYTSTGTYDHNEVIGIVTKLSQVSGIEGGDLVKSFGKHLLRSFSKLHPDYFEKPNALELFKSIDNYIHVEVKKLNPDAELPRIDVEELDEKSFTITYNSERPFAQLAQGLIEETCIHFNESYKISSESVEDPCHRKFLLERI